MQGMGNIDQNPPQDLDRIRDILFGEQQRALEARIAELQGYLQKLETRVAELTETVATESATLRREHAKRADLSSIFAEAARRLSPAPSSTEDNGDAKPAAPAVDRSARS